jgi:HSP20 family protein
MEDRTMAEAATRLPIKTTTKEAERTPALSGPMELLRRDFSRLFGDIGDIWRSPLRSTLFEPLISRDLSWAAIPAVDLVEKEKAFEISAELPGMDEKNIEVKVANGTLCIKGEKEEEKEERQKDYYLSERRYGTFERRFPIPDGIDTDKVEATFAKGVLTVTLPKTPAAQAAEKKIAVKTA